MNNMINFGSAFPADVANRRSSISPYQIQRNYAQSDFPPMFPYDVWMWQHALYERRWNYYSGANWNETVPGMTDAEGKPVLKWPLSTNFLKTLCMKRNYTLWGETPDSAELPVTMKAVPRVSGKDELDTTAQQRCGELSMFVNKVFAENNCRTLLMEGGLVQQFLGGVVFRVGWNPSERDIDDQPIGDGIFIEMILPDFFLPIWDTRNPNRLLECWFIQRVPNREATLRFGHQSEQSGKMNNPIYIEHWTRESVTITLDDKPIMISTGTESITYKDAPNPFGFVPFVYIPTERDGGYYGASAIDGLERLAEEVNSRLADIGDVIQEGAHREIFIRNVNNPVSRDIGGTRPAIDLGLSAGPSKADPDAFSIDPPTLPDALVSFPKELRNLLGIDAFIPAVAEGTDEGSQRSALTLAFRMWPLTTKMRAIRASWQEALSRLSKMIAEIAIQKGVGGISREHTKNIIWEVDWSPMIPRDRETEVNEAILSVQAGIMHPTTAIERLHISDNPLKEYKMILEHQKAMSEMDSAAKEQEAETETRSVKASMNTDKM